MPISPTLNCELTHTQNEQPEYQVIADYDRDDEANCKSFYDGKCQAHWDDYSCQDEYETAESYYEYGYSDMDPDEYMQLYLGNVCEPFVPDTIDYDNCLAEIDFEAFN
jgi:hypothetical protein